MGARSDMPLPRRLEGREVGLEVLELLGWIRPILPARFPERAQALFVGDCVLDDDGTDALRVGERHPESNGPAIVLHEQDMVCDPKLGGELTHQNVIRQ